MVCGQLSFKHITTLNSGLLKSWSLAEDKVLNYSQLPTCYIIEP